MYKFNLYILLLFSIANAQTINFEKALAATLENSKKIKQQKLNIEQKDSDLKKIKSFSYGNVNLIHEASRTNHAGYVFNYKLSSREASFKDFGFSEFGGPIDTQPFDLNQPENRNNFTTKVTYNIPLFTGFKLSNQKDMISLQKKIEKTILNKNIKDLSYEVLKAYNNAVVAKEYIKAIKKAKEVTNIFEITASEFYKEGLVTKIDKKQAKVYSLNIQSKLTQAKNNYELTLAYLSFLTNIEKIEDIQGLKTYNNLFKTTNSYKKALENRDDMKAITLANQISKKNIDLNKAAYYPNIYTHLEYGVNDDRVNFSSEKDYYLAMIGIKFPLFDPAREYEFQKSKLEYQKSLLQKQELEDAIKLELKKATLNLQAKEKLLKEKKEAKVLAYEVLEQSKQMYKNQLIAMSELLKQEAIYRENEAAFILAKYEHSLAQGKLNLTIGNNINGESK